MITDKQVEAACGAWAVFHDYNRTTLHAVMRAALEAAEAAREVPNDRAGLVRHAMKLMQRSPPWDGKTFSPELSHTLKLLAAAPSSAEQPAAGAPEADERAPLSLTEIGNRLLIIANDLDTEDEASVQEELTQYARKLLRAGITARAQSSAAPVAVAEVCAIGLGDGITAGSRMILRPLTDAVFPVGTKLYTAPPADARDGDTPQVAWGISHDGVFPYATLMVEDEDVCDRAIKRMGGTKLRIYTAPFARARDWPECSGDPACCPENEGYGCCKPNPPADRAMGAGGGV